MSSRKGAYGMGKASMSWTLPHALNVNKLTVNRRKTVTGVYLERYVDCLKVKHIEYGFLSRPYGFT